MSGGHEKPNVDCENKGAVERDLTKTEKHQIQFPSKGGRNI